jgi:hypothetical protein
MIDNKFDQSDRSGGMEVMGCEPTCSGEYDDLDDEKVCHPAASHSGELFPCSGNATSKLGRDCTPFADTGIGSYKGAINLQIAWRRNNMSRLVLHGPDPDTWIKEGAIPLIDGGVIEDNYNATGGRLGLEVSGVKSPIVDPSVGGWTNLAENVLVHLEKINA